MSRAAPDSSLHGIWLLTQSSNSGMQGNVKVIIMACSYSDSHTSQVGQTSTTEVKKCDLRAELLAAEQEAANKKRKAEGKPPLAVDNGTAADEESNKRRKLLQEALELDKDDSDEEDDKEKQKDEDAMDEDDQRYGYVSFSYLTSC